MTSHLFFLFACIICVELSIVAGFLNSTNDLRQVAKSTYLLIRSSKVSDVQKEKKVPIQALKILKISLHLLVIFITMGVVFFGLTLLSNDLYRLTFSVPGIIESIVMVIIYLKVRQYVTRV